VHKIIAENLIGNTELDSWLDDKFLVNIPLSDGTIEDEFDHKDIDEYGRRVVDLCPDSLGLSLFWIRNSTDGYFRVNHFGKVCIIRK